MGVEHCIGPQETMTSSLRVLLLLCTLAATTQASLKISNLRASDLPGFLTADPDAYVQVHCGAANLGKTATRNNNHNPWWEEDFHHFRAKAGDVLKLEVYDSDIGFDDLLGTCQRSIQVGVWNNLECYLKRGGTLYYSYAFTK